MGHLGVMLGDLGAMLGLCWAILVAMLGPCWAIFGAILEPCWAITYPLKKVQERGGCMLPKNVTFYVFLPRVPQGKILYTT